MFIEPIAKIVETAIIKTEFAKHDLLRYFVLSMLAGLFVGFGVCLVIEIGAPLHAVQAPGMRALMGASFAVALSLVIFAGSELFTGNTMIMTIGSLAQKISWRDTLQVWIVSYLGNLAGSLLMAIAMLYSGLVDAPAQALLVTLCTIKMDSPFSQLLIRGILCNMLVCLAVWISFKCKEEIAKLVMIFWCLFAFVGAGFEHSIANMTLLGIGVMMPHDVALISWRGYVSNLIPVTIGNFIGGAILVGAAYWFVASREMKPRCRVRSHDHQQLGDTNSHHQAHA